MSGDKPWETGDPLGGLPPHLIPNPPSDIPEAPAPGDAMATASPFTEPLDIKAIMANLTLDRPLKLFIPKHLKHPDYEYRIINSIPTEIADAHNKGWRQVTNPEHLKLFDDLVAGTDKNGKAFRPILCARPKQVGEHVREQGRLQLQSLYAGMDPKNKELNGKYTENAVNESKAQFQGDGWRIRTKAR